jgi:uncharacterized coiled-coil DUF342 family protein
LSTLFQAQENADEIRRQFEDLQNDIQSGTNPDSWANHLKQIDTIFSNCSLPKLEKDELFNDVDQIRQTVRAYTNQQAKAHIRKVADYNPGVVVMWQLCC